jgi:VCBS repeat-containing protein
MARKPVPGTNASEWIDVSAQLAGHSDGGDVSADQGDDGVYGSAYADSVRAGLGNDMVWGNAGNDTLEGGDGSDLLWGGEGNDSLIGGDGYDSAWGGLGQDRMLLGTGDDQGYGEDGNDVIDGGDGNNGLWGGLGDDTLIGGAGDDLLFGEGGADSIAAGAGANCAVGGDGNDTLSAGEGHDTIGGDAGHDLIDAGAGDNRVWGGLGNDRITAGSGDDSITGDEGNDTVEASAGHNTVHGGLGNDRITAGSGDDSITGDEGNDSLEAGSGNNTVHGGMGTDLISAGTGNDSITGDDGADRIAAGDGNDVIHAGSGNDEVLGGAGNDLITGDSGNDTIAGGAGADTIQAGSGDDLVVYTLSGSRGLANLANGGAGIDTLRLDFTREEWLEAGVQKAIAKYVAFLASPGAASKAHKFDFSLTARDFENAFALVEGEELTLADDAVTAGDDAYSVSEDGSLAGSVLENDEVPDLVAKVELVKGSGPSKGTLKLNADGSFSYDPGTAFQYLAAGQTAEEGFTYRVTDADGDTGLAQAIITIRGENDAAKIGGQATGTVQEDATGSASGKLTVVDPDAGENCFRSVSAAELVQTYGTFTFDHGTGAWAYLLNNDAAHVQGLAKGQVVQDTLTVSSKDGTADQVIVVTITGTNDAPTIQTAGNTVSASIAELANVSGSSFLHARSGAIVFQDSDLPDTAHTASVVPAGGGVGYLGTFSLAAVDQAADKVAWSFQIADGALDSLAAGEVRTQSYVVKISDGAGGTVEQSVTVTLTGAAEPTRGAPNIVVFDHSFYVDTSGDTSAEADNVQAFLSASDFSYATTTALTTSDWMSALNGRNTLIIPELEFGNLGVALDPSVEAAIANWVAAGNRLILFADAGSNDNTFLNDVFEFNTASSWFGGSSVRTGSVAGTQLVDNAATLPWNDGTYFLTAGSLPAGSEVYYASPGGDIAVAAMSYGRGEVIYCGYDFYEAQPRGYQDGGWLSVLRDLIAQTDSFI